MRCPPKMFLWGALTVYFVNRFPIPGDFHGHTKVYEDLRQHQ
jgi:hypothetical protein